MNFNADQAWKQKLVEEAKLKDLPEDYWKQDDQTIYDKYPADAFDAGQTMLADKLPLNGTQPMAWRFAEQQYDDFHQFDHKNPYKSFMPSSSDEEPEKPLNKLDSVPNQIKKWFFSAQTAPCVLDYDVIGFDIENGFVSFEEHNLTELICRSHFNKLCSHFEGAYAEEVSWLNVKQHFGLCLNNVLWDIDTGAMLMLGQKNKIVHAVKGLQQLTEAQVKQMYGEDMIYKHLEWPKTNKVFERQDKSEEFIKDAKGLHWTLMGLERFTAPVICQVVDLIDKGQIKKTYKEFAYDLHQVNYMQFQNFTEQELFELDKYGEFYPALVKKPQKYIEEQPDLVYLLKTLRHKGKHLFLMSNSHINFVDLLMKTTLGMNDWKDLFDHVLVNCEQPLF